MLQGWLRSSLGVCRIRISLMRRLQSTYRVPLVGTL
nr:MAG TPA: hypothetical protein [Caudoviricetes sp.]